MKMGSLAMGTEIPQDTPSEKMGEASCGLTNGTHWNWCENGRINEGNKITQPHCKRNGVRGTGHCAQF